MHDVHKYTAPAPKGASLDCVHDLKWKSLFAPNFHVSNLACHDRAEG